MFKRQVWTICLASGCVLLILALLFAFGKIKPQPFAFDCIGVTLMMFVAFYVVFKSKTKLERKEGRTDSGLSKGRSVRHYAMAAALTVFLVFGWWFTRGGPLAPRIIGTAFDLLLIWGVLHRR